MNIELNQTTLQPVKNIKVPDVFYRRLKTGMKEFDEFLSGGWLPGSSFTFTARAGLGKSTLMLQALNEIAKQNCKVAYISCEESIYQLAYTCERLNVDCIEVANINNVDDIAAIMAQYNIVIVDSFQGLTCKHNLNSRALEKYCIEKLVNTAKKTECVVGIICHQTKNGDLKGSTLVLHEVDATMELTLPEEIENEYQRVLSFSKNRFGVAREMACQMTETGYTFSSSISTNNVASKQNKHQIIWYKILNIPGDITIKQVMPLVDGNVMKAMMILREMVLNEMLMKNGRGNEAIYQKNIHKTSTQGEAIYNNGRGSLPETSLKASEAGA